MFEVSDHPWRGEAPSARSPPTARVPLVARACAACAARMIRSIRRCRDCRLMRRLAGGDSAALGELYERNHPGALLLAEQVVQHADLAEDVAEDAFVQVCDAAARWAGGCFRAWLRRIVVNVSRDTLRRERRRAALPLVDIPDQGGVEPPDAVARAEEADRLAAALQELPRPQRLAVVLHAYEGLSHGEIANRVACRSGAVESRIARGYAHLRAALTGEEETAAAPRKKILQKPLTGTTGTSVPNVH